MATGGLAVMAIGGFVSASASRDAAKTAELEGRLRRDTEEFRARLFTQQAGQAVAASQRVAGSEQRRAKLAESRALAVAAASGTDASSPGIVKLIADIAGEGAYRSAVALYEGRERSKQLRIEGVSASYAGDSAATAGRLRGAAYRLRAASTVISTAGSMYGRYAQRGPSGDAALIEE